VNISRKNKKNNIIERMIYVDIKNLSCNRVLYWFEELNKIPRGSGNEAAVSNMLKAFANERGLYVRQDEANNIIIKKNASEGMENVPAILIQGHMDMVCEKIPEVEHDFTKDPIKVIYDGDFIRAEGTTLGADDGIAVAYALAALEDDSLVHPELQVLITTDEEVGMGGATAVDCHDITARRVLNIDSEDEGIFTVGCAGGMKTTSVIPVEYENVGEREGAWLSIGGLMGGHSGVEIIKERANANKLLARVLRALNEKMDIRIANPFGGAKDNAIPRDAGCFVALTPGGIEGAHSITRELEAVLNREFAQQKETITITLNPCEREERVFTEDSFNRFVTAVMLMPNGVLAMNCELAMPETSNNLGVIKTTDDGKAVVLTCAVRSSVISRKYEVFDKIKALTELAGGSCEYKGNYPAWEYKSDSALLKEARRIFEAEYGHEPKLETIHAGLECGLLGEKMPGCELISFGPDIHDIHTPKEKADIGSIERTWKLLRRLITEMR
jgi:dipeptidase D